MPPLSEASAVANVSQDALQIFPDEVTSLRALMVVVRRHYLRLGSQSPKMPALADESGLGVERVTSFIMEETLNLPEAFLSRNSSQRQRNLVVLLATAAFSKTHRPCKGPVALLGQCIQQTISEMTVTAGRQLGDTMEILITTIRQLLNGRADCPTHTNCCDRAQSSLLLAALGVCAKSQFVQEQHLDAGK